MPRDIPVGNGDLLVTFDSHYRMRDLYFPRVGKHNHTDGNVQRFGVWVDGEFAWIEDTGWNREIRYREDTLVTDVRLVHERLGIEVLSSDTVHSGDPVFLRRLVVRDLTGRQRDARVFHHLDFSINGSPVGDTANYDPDTAGVILYKDDSYFLINACDPFKCGIDHWAIGAKRVGGAEGTWRDAEDGKLGRNPISQGSVDATVGCNLRVPPLGEATMNLWIACGHSYAGVKALNRSILENTPERLIARTEAYWRLWSRKESLDLRPLSEPCRRLFYRSQLVLRTQIDNGGAILAANDTDITHFAGDHYSYCWMRDGALVAHALVHLGQSELSRQFFRFAERCVEPEGYFLHKYTPEGRLASSWHPWLVNGGEVLPIQQDETSLVIWALRHHFRVYRDVEFIKPLYERLVVAPAEFIMSYRDANGLPRPSWDLWEERRGIHTFTVATVIAALSDAADFAADFGERDRAVRYREAADLMRDALRKHLWNETEQRFARCATPEKHGYRLDMTHDSANFALWATGALPVDDPQVISDMKAVHDRLWCRTPVGGCARYENDYYHQIETTNVSAIPGNPWIICTLWMAQWKIASAQDAAALASAAELLEWVAQRALPSGVLAEQLNPHTGEPVSVSPLTWSHATFAATVLQYVERAASIRGGEPPRRPPRTVLPSRR